MCMSSLHPYKPSLCTSACSNVYTGAYAYMYAGQIVTLVCYPGAVRFIWRHSLIVLDLTNKARLAGEQTLKIPQSLLPCLVGLHVHITTSDFSMDGFWTLN